MSGKDVIFILGTGRAGTSALTRVLSLCGCTLPESVIGPAVLNPKGSWEPIDVWKLNNEFLIRHGTPELDPTMRLQEMVFEESEKEDFIGKIQACLTACPRGRALVIKELCLTDLMAFWLEAAHREGFSVKVIIPIRHPQEVFASFSGSYGSPPPESSSKASLEWLNAFWLKRNLLAERHSRGLPRIFVEYSNLLKDWRAEVARVSKALAIDLNPDESRVDDFLTRDLYRNRCSGPVTDTFGYHWVSRVYTILSGAAQDAPIHLSALDEIYDAYWATERSFRMACAGFYDALSRFDPQKFQEAVESMPVWKSGRDF